MRSLPNAPRWWQRGLSRELALPLAQFLTVRACPGLNIALPRPHVLKTIAPLCAGSAGAATALHAP
jgi:hypothetical protein